MPYIQSSIPSLSGAGSPELPEITEPGTVVILATGGTIVGVGKSGKSTGYASGVLPVQSLVASVPDLNRVAPLAILQLTNLNSDDITSKDWIGLARVINTLAENRLVAGFVITHGTDTMDETAYFLNLTVKTDKPVVLTGSMRPTTAISPDGPENLYEAVTVAADPSSRGHGVMVVFSGKIISARSIRKVHTSDVDTMSGGEMGCMGIVTDSTILFYAESSKRHTLRSEFDVSGRTELPKVTVLYFHTDADPELLKAAAALSDGSVIAGAGAGEYSKPYLEALRALRLPVVISSRTGDGIILQSAVLSSGTVAANNLPPQKAAVLLRVALTKTKDFGELVRIFGEY